MDWARPMEAYALIRTSRATRGRGRKERVSRVTAWPLPPLLWETVNLEKGGARLLFRRALGRAGGRASASTWSSGSAAQGCSRKPLTTTPGILCVLLALGEAPHLHPLFRLGKSRAPVLFASDLFVTLPSFPTECAAMVIVSGQRNLPGVPTPVYFKLSLS